MLCHNWLSAQEERCLEETWKIFLSSSISPRTEAHHPRRAQAGTGKAHLLVQHSSQIKRGKLPRHDADTELMSSFPSWLASHPQHCISHGLPASLPSLTQGLQAQAANSSPVLTCLPLCTLHCVLILAVWGKWRLCVGIWIIDNLELK